MRSVLARRRVPASHRSRSSPLSLCCLGTLLRDSLCADKSHVSSTPLFSNVFLLGYLFCQIGLSSRYLPLWGDLFCGRFSRPFCRTVQLTQTQWYKGRMGRRARDPFGVSYRVNTPNGWKSLSFIGQRWNLAVRFWILTRTHLQLTFCQVSGVFLWPLNCFTTWIVRQARSIC